MSGAPLPSQFETVGSASIYKKLKSPSIRNKISLALVTSISSATCSSPSTAPNAIFLRACHTFTAGCYITLSFKRCRNTVSLISLNSRIYALVEEMLAEDDAACHAIKHCFRVPKIQLFLEKEVC